LCLQIIFFGLFYFYALGCMAMRQLQYGTNVNKKKHLTRKDIAVAAGVSPSTVSRALAHSPLLPAATIDKVCRIAKELGYRPNQLARRLATNKSFQIGVVAPLGVARKGTFQVGYFAAILDAMVSSAYEKDYSVTIFPYSATSSGRTEKLVELVSSRHVDGLILLGLKQRSRIPSLLSKAGIPLVLIGSHSSVANVFSVNCDPGAAITSMLHELERRDYRKLIYVGGNLDYFDAGVQRRILLKKIESSKIELIKVVDGDYSRRSGYAAAELIMKLDTIAEGAEKCCVFLANDRMASGFYRYCNEHGLRIPQQLGVVGSDDDDAARALYPDLTTIRQPRPEMGRTAIKLMTRMLDGEHPKSVILDKTFVLRASI